jgi:hypothetical protein
MDLIKDAAVPQLDSCVIRRRATASRRCQLSACRSFARLALVGIVLTGLSTSPIAAQDQAGSPGQPPAAEERSKTHPEFDRRQIVPFLDATYVAFARSRRVDAWRPEGSSAATTFEADIVPNFVIRQNFFDVIGAEEGNRLRRGQSEWRWAWSVVGVPMVKLRMFVNDPSAPVRTPSYMPKGTGQIFLFKPRPNRVDLLAFQATLGHHSNGQDGCLFANQSTTASGECAPVPPADKTYVEPNRRDGSFSTNYLHIGARFRWVGLAEPSIEGERTSDRDATVGLDVEVNPTEFLGGAGINAELKSRYGGTRWTVFGGGALKNVSLCYRLEGKASAKFIPGHGESVPAVAGSFEGQCLFRDTNWGVFVRYYLGQDYYNLAFQDNVRRIQVGATYSQEGFLRFRVK